MSDRDERGAGGVDPRGVDQDTGMEAAGANEGEVDPGVGVGDSTAAASGRGGLRQPASGVPTDLRSDDADRVGAGGGAATDRELASTGGNDATVAYSEPEDPDQSGVSAEQDIIGDDPSG